MEEKYKIEEPIYSSDFWYDLTHGGYITPSEILNDDKRAKLLENAIELLMEWQQELYDDDMLEDL